MTTVQLRAVSARYRDRQVVHEVSETIRGGSWLAVIGPNGAGKSTLLKSVAGLVSYTGQVLVAGQDIQRLSARQRAKLIGYAPQRPALPDYLTTTDYVLLGRTPHLGSLVREGAADLDVVRDVLDRVDLAGLADRPLRTLSGGERQRAVLGRVLAQQAQVLLLDEPTTGLDIGHAQAMLELIDRLRREDGATVVSTLHDLTWAAQYADHLLLLDGGRVAASGPASDVLNEDRLTKHYAARVEILATSTGSPVVTPVRGRQD
jgi:cobalamin transport system ATP-binding protein